VCQDPRLCTNEEKRCLALSGVAMGLCYLWDWPFLRYITSELNIRGDARLGISLQRVSSDAVFWKGVVYRYVNACTFADVWCGAVPLLWSLRRTIPQNLARIAIWVAGLLAFNVIRLCFSDALFDCGLPWDLAHNVVSGFSYFAVWIAITHYRERLM